MSSKLTQTNTRAALKIGGGLIAGSAVGPYILQLLGTDWNHGAQLCAAVVGAVIAVVGWVKGIFASRE